MKKSIIIISLLFSLAFSSLQAQTIQLNSETLDSNKVAVSFTAINGKRAVRVEKDSTVKEADEATFAKTKNIDFHNGTIEVKIQSRLLKTAKPTDRGFIGLAFRINADNSKFECIYIRPTNGRAEEQIRRNHSIQYFSYPDYKFDRLRNESPEKYESYADMGLDEWIQLKIVVKDKQAKLYLNNNKQPSLIVNDLKHGESASGAIGLFVDVGTEGYFRDLRIRKEE
jgi:hypothetical protein